FAMDERIHNTFKAIKIGFDYVEQMPSGFSMNIDAKLKDSSQPEGYRVLLHEDMIYALNLAFREFVDLVKNYGFGDFKNMSINIPEAGAPWVLSRDQLESFRRKEVDIS